MSAPNSGDAFDVAVVGAGPAGSAAALRLARCGYRVVLLERTCFEQPRVGESLAPEVQPLLRKLGLWGDFLALHPLPSWGTRSCWGEAQERSQSHLFSPFGCGWHIDRRAFDRLLAYRAEQAGASLRQGTAWLGSEPLSDGWLLRVRATRSANACVVAPIRTLRARFLLDASGRRAHLARSLGAQLVAFDRLIGIAMRGAGADDKQLGHLLIEAAPEGWWYSAPLPQGDDDTDNTMIAMLMTDADLCAPARLHRDDGWHASLRTTTATRARLVAHHDVSKPQVHCAGSQRLRRSMTANGDAWLAIGDAALAVDPISGSGVLRALRSALAAADAIIAIGAQRVARARLISDYETDRDRECVEFLAMRAHYYGMQQRWPNAPFWHRRLVTQRQAA